MGAIMMARAFFALDTETQRLARLRAKDLGVSPAEYLRRLVARGLTRPETAANIDLVFGLGSSADSDIANQKDPIIGKAFQSTRRNRGRQRR